jgi:hypothetical protein
MSQALLQNNGMNYTTMMMRILLLLAPSAWNRTASVTLLLGADDSLLLLHHEILKYADTSFIATVLFRGYNIQNMTIVPRAELYCYHDGDRL